MKMYEVRTRAKMLHVRTFGRKKAEVIKAIQSAEGNFPCFGSAIGDCDQGGCCWRCMCIRTA